VPKAISEMPSFFGVGSAWLKSPMTARTNRIANLALAASLFPMFALKHRASQAISSQSEIR
jgi:hypothetical protein